MNAFFVLGWGVLGSEGDTVPTYQQSVIRKMIETYKLLGTAGFDPISSTPCFRP